MIIFIRNLVVKDIWLKLFSLALAILIWLTVQFSISKEVSPWSALIGRASDEKVLTVPIFVPPMDKRIVSFDPPDVEVTVHGDPKSLKNLKPENLRAQINLTGIESANGMRRRVEVILPENIAYTHLSPEEVEVRLSPKN